MFLLRCLLLEAIIRFINVNYCRNNSGLCQLLGLFLVGKLLAKSKHCNTMVIQETHMRQVLSISVSPEEKKRILARAKKSGRNVSAYILYALEIENDLISEDELLARCKRARENYRNGDTKELSSLADLM